MMVMMLVKLIVLILLILVPLNSSRIIRVSDVNKLLNVCLDSKYHKKVPSEEPGLSREVIVTVTELTSQCKL